MSLEFENVSADAAPRLRTARHGYRDASGRYAPLPHRQPVLVRETVTGEMRPGPSSALLFRHDGLNYEQLHSRADYSRGPAISSTFPTDYPRTNHV